MPLLPADFDPRFHVCVPEDQWSELPLRGDEPCEVLGATPEGQWRFRLPRRAPGFSSFTRGQRSEHRTHLDTVLIDGNSQPVIGSRTATSFVSAKSGDIIVLGGLQRKTQSRSTSRLGGVPIIGDPLGSRKRETTRNDLVFFIRPYVLTNTEADNAEALRRLERSPQKKDVESVLSVGQLPDKR